MKTEKGLVRISWVGPNTPLVDFEEQEKAFFPTKAELVDLRDVISLFIESYPESFNERTINHTDREENWE